MDNPWIARFANEPALVAPHLQDRFEACLEMLASDQPLREAMAARSAAGGDPFWDVAQYYRPYVVQNGILLIPVRGVLLNDFPYQFGAYATGYEYIAKALDRGLGDSDVKGIAYVTDSPGGMVAGNFDLVDKIYEARATKPSRAFAAEIAYSAAYSIASAPSRLVVARTGGVGSIGVVMMHVDFSKSLEMDGVKVSLIFAGKHKVDTSPYAALSDDARARLQFRADDIYSIFVDSVSRNRNLDAAAVRDTEALTFTATEAVANGLADQIGALDGALAEFAADITNPDQGDTTMTNLTVASVKTDHAAIASALVEEGKALGKQEAEASGNAATATAVTGERARIVKLDGFAKTYAGNAKAVEIIDKAKADGSSPEAVAVQLVEAGVTVQAQVLGAIKDDDKTALGAAPAAPGAAVQTPQTKEGWTAEWNASAELQAGFPKVEHYVAYKAAAAGGKVRILEGRTSK